MGLLKVKYILGGPGFFLFKRIHKPLDRVIPMSCGPRIYGSDKKVVIEEVPV